MVQFVSKLTALAVQRLQTEGMHSDGAGLYLQITSVGARSWIFRFMLRGRRREMGLGSLRGVSLAEARKSADECRKLLAAGQDPIQVRKKNGNGRGIDAANTLTFARCAELYLADQRPGWRNTKHALQWESTLRTYANPVIGEIPVADVDTELVKQILDPIWTRIPETAMRVRGRIESILDWAAVNNYRPKENPARWGGNLKMMLPASNRLRRVKHHAALPYEKLPTFMVELRQQDGIAARALEFLILTAARTGEVLGTRPEEIQDGVWVVPAERMKTHREHRVPLCDSALRVVASMAKQRQGPYIFSGLRPTFPMSNMAMLSLLRRMGRTDITSHGFRSTFRDWAAECTDYPGEVAEMALAHDIENKVEAAYRRGNLFKKRCQMMADWGRFCDSANQVTG